MNEPRRTHQPAASIWPVTIATGVGLAATGVVTSPLVLLAGALITLVALIGWIRQAVDEAPS
jgi:hypothetical protein